MIIRPAEPADAEALAKIYGWHVLNGTGTFEETPPTAADMEARRRAVADRGLPYLVAAQDGRVLGFAYAAPFRTRAAYRYTVEDSIYLDPEQRGRGLGKALLVQVIDACEALGLRQVVAVIGDSANAASIGVHRSLGFEPAGVTRGLGYKGGRWLDVVWMQKALNGGDQGAPDGAGLDLEA
jgi:L-amino acid N-acyltransferase YncA